MTLMMKPSVFFDSSVWYSAITSRAGGAREVLRHHFREQVAIVTTPYVVMEVTRNLAKKAPMSSNFFERILRLGDFESVAPSRADVLAAARYVELKDAPIIAASIAGNCPYLLTFDRKHLIDPPPVRQQSSRQIMTPGSFLQTVLLQSPPLEGDT
jgi:predicted nucleic acid-binding protein